MSIRNTDWGTISKRQPKDFFRVLQINTHVAYLLKPVYELALLGARHNQRLCFLIFFGKGVGT